MLSGSDEMKYIQSFNTISNYVLRKCRLNREPVFTTEAMADLNFFQVGLAAVVTHFGAVKILVVGANYHFACSAFLTTQLIFQFEIFNEIDIGAGKMMNHSRRLYVAG